MKIISSFRDYYDYMVGKYGMDEKIVYVRVPEQEEVRGWTKTGMYTPDYLKFSRDRFESWRIAFCGREYQIFYMFGEWFFGPDVMGASLRRYPDKQPHFATYYTDNWKGEIRSYLSSKDVQWAKPTDINDKLKCPVVVNQHIKNPRLSDMNFAKIYSPSEAFITISNWLSREKVIIDKQSDKEKILSHGFDLKTSFRKEKAGNLNKQS